MCQGRLQGWLSASGSLTIAPCQLGDGHLHCLSGRRLLRLRASKWHQTGVLPTASHSLTVFVFLSFSLCRFRTLLDPAHWRVANTEYFFRRRGFLQMPRQVGQIMALRKFYVIKSLLIRLINFVVW